MLRKAGGVGRRGERKMLMRRRTREEKTMRKRRIKMMRRS